MITTTPVTCSIHQRDDYIEISRQIADGESTLAIERYSRQIGEPVKAETISRHIKRCLSGDRRNAGLIQQAVDIATGVLPPGVDRATVERDFAQAVQRKALADLAAGALDVTTRDGLAAQQLIDKRAEKEKDREFILDLARLISGGGNVAPPELIEGEFIEVDRVTGLLAPPALRDDDTIE